MFGGNGMLKAQLRATSSLRLAVGSFHRYTPRQNHQARKPDILTPYTTPTALRWPIEARTPRGASGSARSRRCANVTPAKPPPTIKIRLGRSGIRALSASGNSSWGLSTDRAKRGPIFRVLLSTKTAQARLRPMGLSQLATHDRNMPLCLDTHRARTLLLHGAISSES